MGSPGIDIKGDTGMMGEKGDVGSRGITGVDGDIGDRGTTGTNIYIIYK